MKPFFYAAVLTASLLPSLARAETYAVGPTRTYRSPCALLRSTMVTLRAGDVVEVDAGTYSESCVIEDVSGAAGMPITLRGAAGARPVLSAMGMALTGEAGGARAVLQIQNASHWVIEHLELRDAANAGYNAAGVRVTGAATDVVLRDVSVHGNQMGVVSDTRAQLEVLDSEVYENGVSDEHPGHNLFLVGDRARLSGNSIRDARGGQNLRLRLRYAEVTYNEILRGGSYDVDLLLDDDAEGGDSRTVMIGNVLMRAPTATNAEQCVVFGADMPAVPLRSASLYMAYNTVILRDRQNTVVRAVGAAGAVSAVMAGNVVHLFPVEGGGETRVAFDAATASALTGSNNWVTEGIAAPMSFTMGLTGADPGLVSRVDLSPRMGSPLLDRGVTPPTYTDADGMSRPGTPTRQFQSPAGTVARTMTGTAMDVGALESGVGTPPDAGPEKDVPAATDASEESDAGVAPDTGTPDAGPTDDLGAQPDATITDVAVTDVATTADVVTADVAEPDAGEQDAGTAGGGGSDCGCAVPGHATGSAAAMLALAAAGALRRRRFSRR